MKSEELGDLVKIILPMTRAQALRPYSEFAITLRMKSEKLYL